MDIYVKSRKYSIDFVILGRKGMGIEMSTSAPAFLHSKSVLNLKNGFDAGTNGDYKI